MIENVGALDLEGGWSLVLFETSSSLGSPRRLLSLELYLQVYSRMIVLVCFAVTVRGLTHATQEMKNPKQLSGWSGHWGFIDTSVYLELKQANLD